MRNLQFCLASSFCKDVFHKHNHTVITFRMSNLTLFIQSVWFWQTEKMGFPDGSVVWNPPANAGDPGSIPGSGRSPVGGNGSPL